MENKRPNIKTKHSEIAEYWMNKFILPDGTVSDKMDSDGFLVCLDAGEPECFICGMSPLNAPNFPMKTYEKKLNGDDYLNVWNMTAVKAVLERAHIIPYSLGGKDTPSNLMCLCKKCHKSPQVISAKDICLRALIQTLFTCAYMLCQGLYFSLPQSSVSLQPPSRS